MTYRQQLLSAGAAILALASWAGPASAQVSGMYVAGAVGANVRHRSDVSGQQQVSGLVGGSPSAGQAYVFPSLGLTALGSVGYGFGNNFRVELEAGYRYNEVRKERLFGRDLSTQTGSLANTSVFGNVFYDFSMLSFSTMAGVPITPYTGVGVGVMFSEWKRVGGTLGANRTANVIDDLNPQLGLQAMGGIAIGLGSMVPGLSATAELRGTFGVNSSDMDTRSQNTVTNAALMRQTKPNANFNYGGLAGLRYEFNAPAAAPVVAPAPAPAAAPGVARTYLVFFDWDRADLTARAREIITEAAANARRANVTRIEVAGHADRSGDATYNQRLSQRRAEAVAAELVRQGVTRSNISVQAFGESRPLVPTADNVREPQNRRVEIVLR